MNVNLNKVLNALVTDEKLAEKMTQCKSPEEAYELARTVADGYTQEEFQAMMAGMKTTFSKYSSSEGEVELTEADMSAIAGGADADLIVCSSVAVAVGTCSALAGSAL